MGVRSPIGLMAWLGLMAAVVHAPPAQSQAIHGCVDRKGKLRIADECRSRETPLVWNQVGPPGMDGADGVDGIDGIDGSDGTDGRAYEVFDGNGTLLGDLIAVTGVQFSPGRNLPTTLRQLGSGISEHLLAVSPRWAG